MMIPCTSFGDDDAPQLIGEIVVTAGQTTAESAKAVAMGASPSSKFRS